MVSPARGTFAVLLVLALLSAACGRDEEGLGEEAAPDSVPAIAGEYIVNGIDPLGAEYSGRLLVEPTGRQHEYRLQWIVTGSIQEGTGRLDGNRLEATWHTTEAARVDARGTASYTVTVDGGMRGVRTVEGADGTGTEEVFPE